MNAPAPTLFDWADKREADLRAVEKRITYWEAQSSSPSRDEVLAKFHHAREVMLAGGECPMRRATVYDVLEAIAALGTLIPTAVGPNRKDKRSPAALVAQFAGVPEEAVSPALHIRSRERAQDMTDMMHSALAAAGHPVTGLTFQDHLRATGRT